MRRKTCILLLCALVPLVAAAADLGELSADRAAVERVYHTHRSGTKQAFEQAMPANTIERLVREELKQEAVLKQLYGVETTPALVGAEVQRIESTTRAPEILREIKAALGSDPERFARTVARPLVVERLLRDRFENDDALHASQRRQAEAVRAQLLAARATNATPAQLAALITAAVPDEVKDTSWLLGQRPEVDDNLENAAIKKQFGPDAKLLQSPALKDRPSYFSDLPSALQATLQAQLRQPGDISAVIEMPEAFLLCVCTERTESKLSVRRLVLPKVSFDQWLRTQPSAP